MLAHTQNDVYFERMKSSIGDKAEMIQYIKPNRVLDVGAGGGEFAAMLEKEGFDVVALDGSREAINRCSARGLRTVEGFTHQISELVPADYFDTITCSSILHEVYSYGNGTSGSAHTLDSLRTTFAEFKHALKADGRLVIRDGIMPTEWDGYVELEFDDPYGMHIAQLYLDMIPFRGTNMREVNLWKKHNAKNVAIGNMESAMEFLYTYTWGVQNFERETQELFGVFTLEGYKQFLTENGFRVLHAEEYLQEGYPEHLKDKVRLTRNGEPVEYPNSNCLIVAEVA